MSTVFVFVDDSGEYRDRESPPKQIERNPFYVRAAVMVPDSQFWQLGEAVQGARDGLPVTLDPAREVKWSEIHLALGDLKRDGEIAAGRDYSYLRDCSTQDLEAYPRTLLAGLAGLPGCRVVVTVSQSGATRHSADTIIQWHIQGLMQRVQFDITPGRVPSNDLAVVVADQESRKYGLSPADLAKFYRDVRQGGDRYNDQFPNLNDSLFFADSNHSAGVQVADFAAGCCFGALRDQEFSAQLWHEYVRHLLRRRPSGEIAQTGIVAVPKSSPELLARLESLFR